MKIYGIIIAIFLTFSSFTPAFAFGDDPETWFVLALAAAEKRIEANKIAAKELERCNKNLHAFIYSFKARDSTKCIEALDVSTTCLWWDDAAALLDKAMAKSEEIIKENAHTKANKQTNSGICEGHVWKCYNKYDRQWKIFKNTSMDIDKNGRCDRCGKLRGKNSVVKYSGDQFMGPAGTECKYLSE